MWAGAGRHGEIVQSVADVMRRGRLRKFGHLERNGMKDWVSVCGNKVVAGVRCVGRSSKTGRVRKIT